MVLVSYKPRVLGGCIAMVMHFLHAGTKRETLPCPEEHMTTIDFITALFCQVDDQMPDLPKHPHASLWPSEVVTLGLLHALKGVEQPQGDHLTGPEVRLRMFGDGAQLLIDLKEQHGDKLHGGHTALLSE